MNEAYNRPVKSLKLFRFCDGIVTKQVTLLFFHVVFNSQWGLDLVFGLEKSFCRLVVL